MPWGDNPKALKRPPGRFDTAQQATVCGTALWRREQCKALRPSYRGPSGGGAGTSLLAPKPGPSHSVKLPETNPLHFSVPVADIKAIVTGKDCPHMKEKSALKQNKVSPEPEAP